MAEPNSGGVIPVKVAVRCRPFIEKEVIEGCQSCVSVVEQKGHVSVDGDSRVFSFDYAFGSNSTQDELYEECILPLTDNLFNGLNVTVLAYGQTGSGKTYTMGTETSIQDLDNSSTWGIIPKMVDHIFTIIKEKEADYEISTKVSFLEVYNDDLLDLLADKKQLTLRMINQDIVISGKQELSVKDPRDVLHYLGKGSESRTKGETAMNKSSSRSHAVFTLYLTVASKGETEDTVTSKCHLVDLAGSERLEKTQAVGERQKEGRVRALDDDVAERKLFWKLRVTARRQTVRPACDDSKQPMILPSVTSIAINMGLFVLGKVIEGLTDSKPSSKKFINYREHLLTQLLRDSLGGNSLTMFIACVSPADSNFSETLNTLRYADKAAKIKNKPIVNRDPLQAELARLKQENRELRQRVHELEGGVVTTTSKALAKVGSRGNLLEQGRGNCGGCEDVEVVRRAKEDLEGQLADLNDKLLSYGESTAKLLSDQYDLDRMHNRLKERLKELVDGEDDQEKDWRDILSKLLDDESYDAEEQAEEAGTLAAGDVTAFESKYSERQMALTEQLAQLTKEIREKEALAKETSQTDTNLQQLKEFEKEKESLEQRIARIEKEKNELLAELKTIKASSKVSEQRRKRLQELEAEHKVYQTKLRDMQKLRKLKAQSDETIKKLKDEITDMKQMKVKLMKQAKAESERYRHLKQIKDKEINKLKAESKKKEVEQLSQKQIFERQQRVLKQKYDQSVALSKRLQAQVEARENARKQNFALENSERTNRLLEKFVEETVKSSIDTELAKEMCKDLVEERAILAKTKATKEREKAEPPKKRAAVGAQRVSSSTDEDEQDITAIDKNLQTLNDQIATLRSQICAADSDSEKRWVKLYTMPQARFALDKMLTQLSESKKSQSRLEQEMREVCSKLETSRRELNGLKRASERKREDLLDELAQSRRECQTQVAALSRMVVSLMNGEGMTEEQKKQFLNTVTEEKLMNLEELTERLQESEKEKKVMAQELKSRGSGAASKGRLFSHPGATIGAKRFAAEKENDSDEKGSDGRRRSERASKPINRLTFGMNPLIEEPPTPSLFSASEPDITDIDSDPSYHEKTPAIKRKSTMKRSASAAQLPARYGRNSEAAVNGSDGKQHKCSCRGKCDRLNCGCRKVGRTCGDDCSCLQQTCVNRDVVKSFEEPMDIDPENQLPKGNTNAMNGHKETGNSTFVKDDSGKDEGFVQSDNKLDIPPPPHPHPGVSPIRSGIGGGLRSVTPGSNRPEGKYFGAIKSLKKDSFTTSTPI